MQGKIVKGIAGFYYVHAPGNAEPAEEALLSANQKELGADIYECKAKGGFRNDNIKPLIGDNVNMEVVDSSSATGSITEILPRNKELIRPAVANADQALVVFALKSPKPNLDLLNRFLIIMGRQDMPVIVCFNKCDLDKRSEAEASYGQQLKEIYEKSGYKTLLISAAQGQGVDEVLKELYGKTTVLAGPSGVGKSSLLNAVHPQAAAAAGELSKKTDRGKHTTRHSQIFCINNAYDNPAENTYIVDTPGFSSIDISEILPEELRDYFPEMVEYEPGCKFAGCMHINEPNCRVKEALSEGLIAPERYENYTALYNELKNIKRY